MHISAVHILLKLLAMNDMEDYKTVGFQLARTKAARVSKFIRSAGQAKITTDSETLDTVTMPIIGKGVLEVKMVGNVNRSE